MSLCIVAVKDLKIYRDQERIFDEDEDCKAPVPDWEFQYDIGYAGFYWLRKDIGDVLHYFYYQDETGTLMLNHPDDAPEYLMRFFLHSDCDGDYSAEDIKALAKSISGIREVFGSDGKPNKKFPEFKAFVEKSAKQNCAWVFG